MRIGLTADVHLAPEVNHPERRNALDFVLQDLENRDISQLIIAGDLFHSDCGSYAGFEETARSHSRVEITVIPGNHDPYISDSAVVGDNISIIDSISKERIGGTDFVFVPYETGSGMADRLGEIDLNERWVLVGHGDYVGGTRQRNPYEAGIYMPLYRKDIDRFRPWRVFLGHIHIPCSMNSVFYPGSPCGMNINETGRRRYLIFDTSTGVVESMTVKTDLLFFKKNFLVLPDDNELERLCRQADACIAGWSLKEDERKKARIRITASGYSRDREAVMNCLSEVFDGFVFQDESGPDLSSLKLTRDTRRDSVAKKALELIEELEWDFGRGEPLKNKVIERALATVYGEGS